MAFLGLKNHGIADSMSPFQFWTLNLLTLDLGMFCHVEEGPAQRGGRGLRTGHEQIQNTHDQVLLIKHAVLLSFSLEAQTALT